MPSWVGFWWVHWSVWAQQTWWLCYCCSPIATSSRAWIPGYQPYRRKKWVAHGSLCISHQGFHTSVGTISSGECQEACQVESQGETWGSWSLPWSSARVRPPFCSLHCHRRTCCFLSHRGSYLLVQPVLSWKSTARNFFSLFSRLGFFSYCYRVCAHGTLANHARERDVTPGRRLVSLALANPVTVCFFVHYRVFFFFLTLGASPSPVVR